jgi:predicted alpha/beta hydrolase
VSEPRAVAFQARDGRTLQGLLVGAAQPRGALVINSATAVLREFYLKFAGYAAQRGWHTLVYDYRGIGASALAPLRTETARMSDWGRLDMPAALAWLTRQFPALPVCTLGHSVGGQLLGAMDNAGLARAHVLWRGEALPPQVFRQWRSWCLSAASFGPQLDADLADSRFAELRGPLLVWGFTDDPIATPPAVAALLASYRAAQIEQRWSAPNELGVRVIGHHGFFAERHRDSLWPGVLDWLQTQLG